MTIREEVFNWFEEARADLRRCKLSIEFKDYAIACFFAQQCIEKCFKALILQVKRKYLRTHDLTRLYSEISEIFNLSDEDIATLTDISQYYITTRYPNAGIELPSKSFTEIQAKRAYEFANKILELTNKILKQYDC